MKRTMYVFGASSVLNMILDPILIYWAGMGIAGAAWGMIVSQVMVAVVLLYWFFVRKDTYVSLSWKGFSWDHATIRGILGVGLPASTEFFMMSILAILINGMLVMTAGTDAVAVYTAGWRLVMFAIIPLVGIAMAVVSVSGAAYGGRHYDKLPVIHHFSILFGLAIALCTSAITWVFFIADCHGLYLFAGDGIPCPDDCRLYRAHVPLLPVRSAGHDVGLDLPGLWARA